MIKSQLSPKKVKKKNDTHTHTYISSFHNVGSETLPILKVLKLTSGLNELK